MRDDMHKVVTERPRAGGRSAGKDKWNSKQISRDKYLFKNVIVKSEVKFESIRKKHFVNNSEKELTDLLSPLERFMHSNIGRNWDDVWSEICQVLKGNGLQANHIKDHIRRWVDKDKRYYREYFYIDSDNILRYKPRDKKKVYLYHYKRVSPNCEIHILNGSWFEITREVRLMERTYYAICPIKKTTIIKKELFDEVIIKKRQLSKKEIKKHNLNSHYEKVRPNLISI